MMDAIESGFEIAESPVDVERMGFGMMSLMDKSSQSGSAIGLPVVRPDFASRFDHGLDKTPDRFLIDMNMAVIVVSTGAQVALAQRQARLGTFQRLALALLIAAEHHGMMGRMEVEVDENQDDILIITLDALRNENFVDSLRS